MLSRRVAAISACVLLSCGSPGVDVPVAESNDGPPDGDEVSNDETTDETANDATTDDETASDETADETTAGESASDGTASDESTDAEPDEDARAADPAALPPEPGATQPMSEPPASEVVRVESGSFVEGEPPAEAEAATALASIVNVSAPEAATNGSTVTLLVELSTPIESAEFVVALAGDTGYHRVVTSDPNGDQVFEVKLEVAEAAGASSLNLSVALVAEDGGVGTYEPVAIQLVESGVGDVKITLSYERTHDLDLHVFEPEGEEISFMNPASANGGRLDLDSGSNCSPAANAENVFWGPGDAPPGTYRVVVSNYEQCSPGDIGFTVRVAHDGRAETFSGSFADGSAGTRVEVASFTR